MDTIIEEIVKNFGMYGVLLVGIGWLIYESKKNSKTQQKDSNELKKDIKDHVSFQISEVRQEISLVDKKIDNVDLCLNNRIDTLTERVDNTPAETVFMSRKYMDDDDKIHLKQIEDVMLLGESMHRVMKKYTVLTKADHMFIGSFHNGTTNLSGIPFCKFDIISECYGDNKIAHDHEFAPVYKDSDILRYGSLFSVLFQNEQMLFHVDPDNDNNELAKYEDIIWRRMYGLGIKQLAVNILRDPDNIPSGFLGIVKYDDEEMDMNMLKVCARELEHIYSVNKHKKYDDKE